MHDITHNQYIKVDSQPGVRSSNLFFLTYQYAWLCVDQRRPMWVNIYTLITSASLKLTQSFDQIYLRQNLNFSTWNAAQYNRSIVW